MNQAVTNATTKGRVRIYAAGGAAINIAMLLRNVAVNPDIIADLEVVMIDTSRANLAAHASDANSYLVEGLDGSGKVRSENSEAIRGRILDILQQHKPADLNIVLSSGAGGSGSVIAPLLLSELIERKAPVIALTIGSTASKLEALNTLNTIKSYEAIAKKRQAPVVMHYLQNSPDLPRKDVDLQMVSTISYLAILFSRRNRELDSKDLQNWLRYSAPITSFQPQLSIMTVLWHEANDNSVNTDLSKLGNIISVATLAPDLVNTTLTMTPEYQTVGILPPTATKGGVDNLSGKVFNYVISDGLINEIAKGLNSFLADLEAAANARPAKTSITGHGEADADGMVY